MSEAGEDTRAPWGPILVFRLLSVIFVCAAAYHVLALVTGDEAARARHATFVAINATLAVLVVRRPPGFAIAFALLCGQQLVSHGSAFLASLHEGDVDWLSLAVIIVMPSVLVLLVIDARGRRARLARERHPV